MRVGAGTVPQKWGLQDLGLLFLLLRAHISCLSAMFPEPLSFSYLGSLNGGFALLLGLSSWVCVCAEGSIPGPLLV